MLKGEFSVSEDPPKDTFLDLTDWLHGIVFVNGFNLGRYFKGGPQKSLYVPGPILREGLNEVRKIIIRKIFHVFYYNGSCCFRLLWWRVIRVKKAV